MVNCLELINLNIFFKKIIKFNINKIIYFINYFFIKNLIVEDIYIHQ